MVRPARVGERSEVVYDERRWKLLERFRGWTKKIMESVHDFEPIVHGSVARGDVDERSDVDVFIPRVVPPYRVELALRRRGFEVWKRELVMATPWQLPKAHIYLDEKRSVTFPLVRPRRLELEFYYFGGAVDLNGVREDKRVPGVDKRLMLIQPTSSGHLESQIEGREAEVAKLLDVSIDVVRERVQVLGRRAEVGRTGLFIERELASDESFGGVFKNEVLSNPAAKVGLKGREP